MPRTNKRQIKGRNGEQGDQIIFFFNHPMASKSSWALFLALNWAFFLQNIRYKTSQSFPGGENFAHFGHPDSE
jgi:hypothetical protein